MLVVQAVAFLVWTGATGAVSQAQTAPSVSSLGFGELPTRNDTYEFGEVIFPYVEFDQRVQVHFGAALPQLALRIGDVTRQASYWYTENLEDAGTRVWFIYVVQANDRDEDGLGMPASALSLEGGSITLASDSSVEVDSDHDAIPDDPSRKVDGAVESAPRIRWLFYPGDTNMPQAGDTYGLGDSIYVSVEWDRAVEYSGNPRLALQIGGQTRYASHNYRSGGNAKITFRYVVEAADMDDDGVSIAANALSLNGGSITLQERPAIAASLTHDALEDDPERKVDGSIAPTVATVAFGGGPASGDTYTLGETIEAVVTFDSQVTLDRRVRLAIEVGSETRLAALSTLRSNRGTSFTFEHVVLAADRDADGISLPANALSRNGATVNANIDHEAVPADPGRKVDGGIAVAPRVTGVSVNRPSRNETFGLGEAIRVRVSFDKPVRVTGFNRGPGTGPELRLKIGDRVRKATIQTPPFARARQGKAVYFVYVVRRDDRADDGIEIPADSLALNGGTITILGDIGTNADLRHSQAASAYEVDGGAVSVPTMPFWAPYNVSNSDVETLGRGAPVLAYLPFDRQVRVTGRPELLVQIGDGPRRLAYLPEWSTPTGLYFGYLVQAGDRDADGLSVPENPVVGGAITLVGDDAVRADLKRGANADFSWNEPAVDGGAVATPTVDMERVSLFWPPQSRGVHGLGDTVRAQFCFNLPVKATSAVDAALTIGARTRRAWLSRDQIQSPPLSECLTFAYTIEADDLDADGVSIPANSLQLNGGSIVLTGDPSIAAELRHEAVADDGIHRVDGGMRDAARVTSVSFANQPADGSAYRSGETIEIRVGFSKALALSGRPEVALNLGASTRRAAYARLVSVADTTTAFASDGFALHFAYTVRPGDVDADGIGVPANSLRLNGGSLTLPGDAGVPADLSHAAVNPDEGRLVDAPSDEPVGTAPAFSTGIAGQVWFVNDTVSLELPVAAGGDGALSYGLTPELPPGLAFDEEMRLISGTALAAAEPMVFEYTATDGDAENPESATLAFSISVIAQSAAEVGAQSMGDDSVGVTWRGRWSDPGRGRLAIEARSPAMDWTMVGMVDPTSGQFVVRGLAPETPYTFRLRSEPAGAAARAVSARTAPEYSDEFSVTTGSYAGPCRTGDRYLCLRDGRFELRADWTNPDRAGDSGVGTASPVDVSDESGLFWFFEPANVELVTKVLDGSRLNGYYWMFFGALSDVEYWLTLRDTAVGGVRRTYRNPPKEICGQSDVRALPGDVAAHLGLSSSLEAASGLGWPDAAPPVSVPLTSSWLSQPSDSVGACESSDERLCLLGDRFSVEVSFIDPNVADPAAAGGAAAVLPSLTTDNTGFFWFFNQENVELAVKVLDGRGINGKFWLLYGALSDVEYEIVVTDTVTGESKTYRNEAGSICGEADTAAF